MFDWNIVIAIVAVVGFITSLIISIITLNITRKQYKKQNDISLFEKKYNLIFYFICHFSSEKELFIKPDKMEEYSYNIALFKMLFPEENELYDLLVDLYFFYIENKSIPDYTKKYKGTKAKNNEAAIFWHGCDELCRLMHGLPIKEIL